jgi:O-antigen ligase
MGCVEPMLWTRKRREELSLSLTIGRIFALPLIFVAMVFTYSAGAIGSYVQIVLLIPLLLWAFIQPVNWRSEIAGLMGLVSFLTLLVIFTVTNPPGKMSFLSSVNFTLFLLLGPSIAAMALLSGRDNALLVVRLAALGMAVSLALAVVQVYVLGQPFATGYAGTRITTTNTMVILSFIAALGVIVDRGRWRYLYLLAPLVGLYITLISTSRGPLIVFVALAGVLALILIRRRWIALFAGLAVAAAVLAGLIIFEEQLGRIGRLPSIFMSLLGGGEDLGDNSANIRWDLYRAAWDAIQQSPWIGHGWAQREAAILPDSIHGPRNHFHAHSDLLNIGVAGGIVGLLAYFAILAAPIVGAWRSVRDSQYNFRVSAAVMLAVGILTAGLFNIAIGFEYLTTLHCLGTAIILGFCRDEPLLAGSAR